MLKKLDLSAVAEEFELINNNTRLFYNTETGEFESYNEYLDVEDCDGEKFEGSEWIPAPMWYDFREYETMVEFAEALSDPHKCEMLYVALEGKGAFRRFRDTLGRVGLKDEWYAFKHKAYVEVVREWCEERNIAYEHPNGERELEQSQDLEDDSLYDVIIIQFIDKMTEDVVVILRDVLNYTESSAKELVRHMLSKKRIALVAIAQPPQDESLKVVGIISAIPQYGVTGWELHPLAVFPEYQRKGIDTLLIETLEDEVASQGGVMMYLGSDDETNTTSLFSEDLYIDTFYKLTNIKNIDGHPFPFYEKHGYKIVGVLPDANGIGKPDILIAKRIRQRKVNR